VMGRVVGTVVIISLAALIGPVSTTPEPPKTHATLPADGRSTCPAKHVRPADLLRRCARKALAGHYGMLEAWQREGYERAVEGDVRKVRAWVTTYYPEEGFPRGQETRYGHGVDERCVAANLLPAYTWVWHPRTGIRQVLDTGARSNDGVARRRGAELWIDYWEPRRGSLWGDDNAGVQQVWIIGR